MACFGVVRSLSLLASRRFAPSLVQGLLFFLLALLLAPLVLAQFPSAVNNDTRTPVPGSGHDYINMLSETVDPSNGSLTVHISTPVPPSRGLTVPFSFDYSSGAVQQAQSFGGGEAGWAPPANDGVQLTSVGWSYRIPALSASQTQAICYTQPSAPLTTDLWFGYIFTDPSGVRHNLGLAHTATLQPNCSYVMNPEPYSVSAGGDDLYGASLNQTTGAVTVGGVDGTVYYFPSSFGGVNAWLPSTIEDRNGNVVTISQGSGGNITETDTAGRSAVSTSAPIGTNGTVSISGLSNPFTVTWETITGGYTSQYEQIGEGYPACIWLGGGGFNSDVIHSIELPNQKYYTFGYDSFGLLSQITYPTGAVVTYTWNTPSSPNGMVVYPNAGTPVEQSGCIFGYYAPMVTQRTVMFDGVHTELVQNFSYTTAWNTGVQQATVQTTVYSSNGSTNLGTFKTVYNYAFTQFPFSDPDDQVSFLTGMPVEQTVQYYDYGQTNLLETVTKGWQDQFRLGCQLETHDGSGLMGTFYSYGAGLSLTAKEEYDYGQISSTSQCPHAAEGGPITAPAGWTRQTATTYQAFTTSIGYIGESPCQVITYGSGTNRVAETDYYYDSGATTTPCGTAGTPSVTGAGGSTLTGHDETNYSASSTHQRGNVTQKTQWLNTGTSPVTTYTYDETGQVLSVTDPNTNQTSYSYADSFLNTNSSGFTTTAGSPPSGKVTNSYLTKVTYPTTNGAAHIEKYSYGYNDGELTQSKDENSQPTTYKYNDSLSRQTETDYPDTGETTLSYNDTAPTPSVTTTKLITSSLNFSTTAIMDGLGHVIQTQLTTDSDGTTYTATAYDGTGKSYQVYNPTRCNPPTSNCGSETTWGTTTYTYDALGRTTQVVEPGGATVSTTHTGRATEVSDEGNGTRSVQRISQVDGLGRLQYVCEVTSNTLVGITPTPAACGLDISATGFLTSYGYDPLGNLTSVAQGGLNGRSFAYDSLSRLSSAQNPESGTINYTYDADGDLYQRIAPKPNQTGSATVTTTYAYDALNRVTAKIYSDGTPAAAYYYDQSSPWGVTSQNPIGRLTESETFNSGGPVLTGAVFSYDPMGRIINQWQCTPLTCGTTSVYLAFGYDLMGDLTSSYNNGDGVTYTNNYDTAARLTSVKSNLSDSQHPGTLITLGGFSPIQKPTGITLGNGIVEDLAYSNRGWLYSMGETPNDYGFNIYNWTNSTLGFAPNGDILYSNDSVNGNWTYTYDDMNRLTKGVCTANCPTAQGMTYAYDRFGNRWLETVTAGSGIQPTYYFNANNQIDISGVTYDAAGNVMNDGLGLGNTYTYDAENRIITAANGYSASYVYDAEGHRVRATVNGQTRDFIYDLNGRNIDEFTPGGSGWLGTWTRGEAYAGSLHIATYANSTTEFDNSDWLSTFRARSDVTGNRIETCTSLPFGEDLTCTGTEVTPIHFTGKERDTESGLDYFGARYYGSNMGRFMSPDPSGLVFASFANPQSLNLYSYAQNNPLIYTDPTGLDCAYLNASGSAIEDGGLDQHSSAGECGKTGGYWVDGSMTNANINANAGTVQLTGTNNGTDTTHASYQDTSVYVDSWLNMPLNRYGHITLGLTGQQQVGQNPSSDLNFLTSAAVFGPKNAVVPGSIQNESTSKGTPGQLRSFALIPVTGMQAQMIQNSINQSTAAPPNYSLNPALGLDCATWAQQVLKDAGIQTGPMQPYPTNLMNQLSNQYTVLPGHQ